MWSFKIFQLHFFKEKRRSYCYCHVVVGFAVAVANAVQRTLTFNIIFGHKNPLDKTFKLNSLNLTFSQKMSRSIFGSQLAITYLFIDGLPSYVLTTIFKDQTYKKIQLTLTLNYKINDIYLADKIIEFCQICAIILLLEDGLSSYMVRTTLWKNPPKT